MFHDPFWGWNSPRRANTLIRSPHPRVDAMFAHDIRSWTSDEMALTARSALYSRKDLHEPPSSCDPRHPRLLAHRSLGPDASRLARPLCGVRGARLVLQLHRRRRPCCPAAGAQSPPCRALQGQFASLLRHRRRRQVRPRRHGFDVATPLVPQWLNLRGGASFLSYTPSTDHQRTTSTSTAPSSSRTQPPWSMFPLPRPLPSQRRHDHLQQHRPHRHLPSLTGRASLRAQPTTASPSPPTPGPSGSGVFTFGSNNTSPRTPSAPATCSLKKATSPSSPRSACSTSPRPRWP